MANIKSKEKNIRRIEKATIRNRVVKSQVRTAIKKAKEAIDTGATDIQAKVSLAKKNINKAVQKGVFHKNNGARKASKLDKYVAKKVA